MPTAHRFLLVADLFAALFLTAGVARADSIIVQGLGPQKVTVVGFANDRLQYRTERDAPGEKEYARVQQLVVDAEPALSAAEAALAGKNADASLDDYVRAIRTTAAPWVKAFAARRILDAAGPDGRFEPRLVAYLALVQVSPADAADRRPALPEAGSRLLDVAVAETESALKAPKLTDAQKLALFDFLTAVHQRRGDDAAVAATVERMAKISPAAANDPAVKARLLGQRLAQAKAAAEKKEYVAAARIIEQSRAEIVDPQQQADALYILAQAKLAAADPTDAPAQRDAALAFMRVVALAAPLPGRPNVLPSLRATADILDRTGDKDAAARLNAQIAREFPEAAGK